MRIAHSPSQLERQPRAVAIGTFDGVHRGHRSVVQAAIDSGLAPTVITFDPHPRIALGNDVELITTLERRLELIAAAGCGGDARRLVHDRADGARARDVRRAVPAGDRRRGRRGRGRLPLRRQTARRSRAARAARLRGPRGRGRAGRLVVGDPPRAARRRRRRGGCDARSAVRARRGRRRGDQRGGTLGYPTANLALEPHLACPRYGIYAGSALGHRAAVSIGTNPHYGGTERRIEPYLLDFDGDLYGKRLVVEVWERLRDEAVFASEEELVAQIGRDVDATRAAVRPPLA